MAAGSVILKTEEEIAQIAESAKLLSATLAEVARIIRPGITTLALDKVAYEYICDHGAVPSFLHYNGFPYSLCISPNEQVVHGMPSEYVIQDGDLISVDCGVTKNGWIADSAYTFMVGNVDDEKRFLVEKTKECLDLSVAQARVGMRTGDIGYACAEHATRNGLGVVKELVGHGVGTSLHEKPEIPNYGVRGKGIKLTEGMVLAIEPMINAGVAGVTFWNDGWTVTTRDKRPSAHFEHTVAITKDGPVKLSDFSVIESALGN